MTASLFSNIQRAKQTGASSTDILNSFEEQQFPNLSSRIKSARDEKFSDDEILNSLEQRFQQEEPTASIGEQIKGLPSAAARGVLKGLERFGQLLGPLEPQTAEEIPAPFEERFGDIFPPQRGPLPEGLERFGEIAIPSLATPLPQGVDPLTQITRAGTSAFAGQSAKELGFGQFGQSIAELFGFGVPNIGKGRIPQTTRESALLQSAENFGLTQQEVAPLIQSGSRVNRFFQRFASASPKAQERLQVSKKGLSRITNAIKESPEAQKQLDPQTAQEFIKDLSKVFEEIPFSEGEKVLVDLNRLTSKPITGKSLINFWRALNNQFSKGNKQVQTLRGPTEAAIQKVDPQLADNFVQSNNLWSEFFDVQSKFKAGQFTEIINRSRPARLVWGLLSGNKPMIAETLGEPIATRLSAEMLTNPRFKALSSQISDTINRGKPQQAQRLFESLKSEIKEVIPEESEKIDKLKIDQFFGS
jgi:hypothetical protein